jgi:hypothetical protein
MLEDMPSDTLKTVFERPALSGSLGKYPAKFGQSLGKT